MGSLFHGAPPDRGMLLFFACFHISPSPLPGSDLLLSLRGALKHLSYSLAFVEKSKDHPHPAYGGAAQQHSGGSASCAAPTYLYGASAAELMAATATPSYAWRGPVGVVIAHPDDESMFFAPTLTALKHRGQRAAVLCLSAGDFYGLGQTRKRELVKACGVLGVKEDDVVVIEHPSLQDGSTETWPADTVASHVRDFVQKFGIKTVLTFDQGGVSGHSDHVAVNRGVALMLRTRSTANKAGKGGSSDSGSGRSALDAFELVTTGMLRKYSGVLDMPWSLATSYGPPLGAFFSSFSARIVWTAMAAHHSQFVWYRRLFVIFSRYAYVNTFKRMQVPPPPPPLQYR